MPEQDSSRTRARDIDRAQTCGLLDAGYGEGQLDPAEYQARTAAAMKAKTLGELDALVSDLQIPDHLVEATRATAPEPAPRQRVPGRVVAAVLAAVLAVGGTLVFATRGDDAAPEATDVAGAARQAPAPAPIPAGEPAPIVIEPIDPLTTDGVREFVRQLGVKFGGDLRVDQVTFYSSYVFVTRMLEDQPHREQDWSFRGGFSTSGDPGARPLDTATVDLADLDVARLGDVIATGANRVGMPSGRVDHIFVRPDSGTEGLVTVQFTDDADRSGFVNTRLDGSVVDISPTEG
ncbi:DUF1707 SHOCT-like domain-containing protein [Rhodococcus tukisamuensis]|uniref:DUF1707 domain-containing protein n=1 Tax=Rhodococcus tukisamuensis TaxID=168276 RepID=A0A1G6UIL4_9NOCA|nr:DUF1707 domain-containing protein [Rhodococcus tukisamuensis]SDD40417.1 protein of unknown function [Rhodococcus tukisamuensis]